MSGISLPPKGNDAKVLGAYFSPLKVEALATPTMQVKVAEGAFWTADNEHQEFIGGISPLLSAPSSDAKWVLLTVTANGALNLVNGASSTNPTLPDVSLYKDELPLAAIFVGDTVTAITNDMIYDLRPMWQIPPDSVNQSQLNDFATITFVNNGLATKAETSGTANSTFTLNSDSSDINNSGLYVGRFGNPTVSIRFNETATQGSPVIITPQWEFTNDGTTWNPIGIAAGSYYTKTDLNNGALDFTYYTKTDLNNGALDFTYYTKNDFNVTGVLDSRYYTETESDTIFEVIGHTHLLADITDLGAQVQSVNSIPPTLGNVDIDLNNLNSVTISGNTVDAVLKFDGSVYRNEVLVLNNLSNVTITTPVANETLFYNGSVFHNRPIVLADISDLASSFEVDYVQTGESDGSPKGTSQDIYGIKTFMDGIVVSGTETVLQTNELKVTDEYIDINYGETGGGITAGVSGIRISRGTEPDAIIQYDEGAEQWEIGLAGNARKILSSEVVQPFWELFSAPAATGSPLQPAVVYSLAFGILPPVVNTTGIQVFVNGVKQIETKTYTVDYSDITRTIVTFVSINDAPAVGSDVEFYGFG